MDILDDIGMSKLSAKVFFFFLKGTNPLTKMYWQIYFKSLNVLLKDKTLLFKRK